MLYAVSESSYVGVSITCLQFHKGLEPCVKIQANFFFFFFWQRIALIKIPLTTQTQYDTIKIIIILYKLISLVGSSFSAKANVFQSVVFRLALLAPLGNVL